MKYVGESISDTAKNYNKIAPFYAKTRQFVLKDFSFFTPYILPHNSILDIGCGSGRGYLFLQQLEIPINYHGIDISQEQLFEAKKQYPQGIFNEGNMLQLSFPSKTFHTILMLASFHHLPTKKDRIRALQEAYRVLIPGGILCMTNWNMFQKKFHPLLRKNIVRWIFSLGKYSYKQFFFPWKNNKGEEIADRYYYAMTKKELQSLAKQAGFTILQNFYTKGDKKDTIWHAYNLVTILKKQ